MKDSNSKLPQKLQFQTDLFYLLSILLFRICFMHVVLDYIVLEDLWHSRNPLFYQALLDALSKNSISKISFQHCVERTSIKWHQPTSRTGMLRQDQIISYPPFPIGVRWGRAFILYLNPRSESIRQRSRPPILTSSDESWSPHNSCNVYSRTLLIFAH